VNARSSLVAALVALVAPGAALAQTTTNPGRSLYVVTRDPRGAQTLVETLSELLAPYRVTVRVVETADAARDPVAVLGVERAGERVTVALPGGATVTTHPSQAAIRVVTALRDELEREPAVASIDSADEPEDEPYVPLFTGAAPTLTSSTATAAPPSLRPARRTVASRWAVELGYSVWSPVGTGVASGVVFGVSTRVSGTSRAGIVLAAHAWGLASEDVTTSQGAGAVWQLPVAIDVAWRARVGRLAFSIGGGVATVVTRVGESAPTLAFGAGLTSDVGVRIAGPFSAVIGARALCMGHTTISGDDGSRLAVVGPFFVSGSAGLRVELP
jgi:hypothetical protein